MRVVKLYILFLTETKKFYGQSILEHDFNMSMCGPPKDLLDLYASWAQVRELIKPMHFKASEVTQERVKCLWGIDSRIVFDSLRRSEEPVSLPVLFTAVRTGNSVMNKAWIWPCLIQEGKGASRTVPGGADRYGGSDETKGGCLRSARPVRMRNSPVDLRQCSTPLSPTIPTQNAVFFSSKKRRVLHRKCSHSNTQCIAE